MSFPLQFQSKFMVTFQVIMFKIRRIKSSNINGSRSKSLISIFIGITVKKKKNTDYAINMGHQHENAKFIMKFFYFYKVFTF